MAQATKERVVYHVVPNSSGEKWVVSQERAEFRREFETKDEAVQFAKERARKEELGVNEAELTDTIVRRAQQAGVRADDYAQQVVNSGQLGALMSEVLRGKALALVLEQATITDESGRPINLDELTKEFDPVAEVDEEEPADDDGDGEPESS